MEGKADRSNSSLSSLNAFNRTSCNSRNLRLFSSEFLCPRPVVRSVWSSSSMILSMTLEHRGKNCFPSSTARQNYPVPSLESLIIIQQIISNQSNIRTDQIKWKGSQLQKSQLCSFIIVFDFNSLFLKYPTLLIMWWYCKAEFSLKCGWDICTNVSLI